MQIDFVVLRLLHIVSGTFWVGSALFFVLILEPRLRALGPTIQLPVMGALAPIMGPALGISGIVTIAAGITLALRIRWGHLDTFLNTGWGWAILTGFVMSITALVLGISTAMASNRMARLGREMAGHQPSPEEASQLQHIAAGLTLKARAAAILLLIAVGSMAAARYV